MTRPNRTTSRGHQIGLTLVELMVSLALGLVLLTAVSILFVQHNQHQAELDRSNRLIDNGRYAMDLLAENIRLAGYYGEFDLTGITPPAALPDPCKLSGGTADLDEIRSGIGFPIQAYDAANTATAAVGPASCGLTNVKPGSDILVIRRAATTATAQAAVPNPGNTTVYIQGTRCETDAALFRVDTNAGSLDLKGLGCAVLPLAPVSRMLTQVYYVSTENKAGDGIPTLKVVELQTDGTFSDPTSLVEGIELLQFSYGRDDGTIDGAPDAYESCAGTDCDLLWDDMVSVKVYMIARNNDTSPGYADSRSYDLGPGGTYTPTGSDRQFKRQAYTQTVRLMNSALRRETP